jgi:hypothetical protein
MREPSFPTFPAPEAEAPEVEIIRPFTPEQRAEYYTRVRKLFLALDPGIIDPFFILDSTKRNMALGFKKIIEHAAELIELFSQGHQSDDEIFEEMISDLYSLYGNLDDELLESRSAWERFSEVEKAKYEYGQYQFSLKGWGDARQISVAQQLKNIRSFVLALRLADQVGK